jgi:tetratricopeptide (TPR) repeat protein
VALYAAAAFVQAGYWRSSERLFLRSLEATGGNFLLQNNLGIEYGRQGRLPEALARFAEAVRIKPDYYLARHNAGEALYRMGRREEALEALLEAHRLRPYELQTLVALGEVSEEMGLREDAADWFRRALEVAPGNGYALEGLARNGAAGLPPVPSRPR